MKQGKEWVQKHRQLILYLAFGVITTVCSLGACFITLRLGVRIWHDEQGDPTVFLDVLASTTQWVVGVLVAFWTNKCFVFTEAERGSRASFKQFFAFSGSRVLTYVLEVFINLGWIALMEWLAIPTWRVLGVEIGERFWAKLVSSVVIVMMNYLISKLFVFREGEKSEKSREKLGN